MTWLIIVLVIALALAPLLHFMPSKLQRHQSRLREAAALQGLFVEFRQPPERERVQPGPAPIYYGKRLPPPRRGVVRGGAWLREEGVWRGSPRRLQVPDVLTRMPAPVFAASVDTGSCGVYWLEQGDEDTVTEIRELLQQWAAVVDREQRR